MNKFGSIIRENREKQNMLLRHLSSELDIDTGLLSKIERGEKTAKRDFIVKISKILGIDYNKLFTLWLADNIFQLVGSEKQALDALEIVKNKIKNHQ